MLTGTTTPSLREFGSNNNEGVLHIPQSSWSRRFRYFSVISKTLVGSGVLPLCRGYISVLDSQS